MKKEDLAQLLIALDLVSEHETLDSAIKHSREIWKASEKQLNSKGHYGDCTKQPITCLVCLTEDFEEMAATIIEDEKWPGGQMFLVGNFWDSIKEYGK